MSMTHILEPIRTFDGVLELAPSVGSEFPEIAWGDHFFYYAPDGAVPQREQPYATVVTKNYPGDIRCDLDRPDRWRLNIHVGADAFRELTGQDPRTETASWDYTVTDVVVPHPVHRRQGWVSVTNPGAATTELAIRLLRRAHAAAAHRAQRRRDRHTGTW